MKFAVYLPPDYATSTRRYPVVYLLHGYSDDESGWIQFGEVNLAADRAIAEREIPPMIIVMPDGGVDLVHQRFPGQGPLGGHVRPGIHPPHRQDLPDPHGPRVPRDLGPVHGRLGLADPVHAPPRAVRGLRRLQRRGLDRGGCGQRWKPQMYDRMFAALFGPPAEKARPRTYFKSLQSHQPGPAMPETELKKVRYYIDCGDDDFLIKGNCALHVALMERKIPHEFRVRDGAHTWSYWRTGIVDGLKFIGQSFHR